MSTFTADQKQVDKEFKDLNGFYEQIKDSFSEDFNVLSMGMSGDYHIAIENGSTMVRIGSAIFGTRT